MFRIMRLIIMFDLPMQTSAEKKGYRKFRKFLIENGYVMMQYSIYSKIILNRSALNLQKTKLQENAPSNGFVDMLIVTERQYTNIETLIGTRDRSNQNSTTERLLFL